jgi:hypothetical protein
MTDIDIPDWRKDASAAPPPGVIPDEEVERAFMDQAYGLVQNKAGKLLTDPHRLGFEIVDKNDKNSRMVGIFAARAGNRLLYIPCFFISGEIKGTDLLYRHDDKLFTRLSEKHVDYLIDRYTMVEGRAIGREHRQNNRREINSELLTGWSNRPGGYNKSASAAGLPEISEVWDEMLKTAALQPILHDFMSDAVAALGSLDTIESWVNKSAAFAEQVGERHTAFFPDGLNEAIQMHKEACAPKSTDLLTLYQGGYGDGLGPEDKDTLFKKGFVLVDDRNPEDLNAAIWEDEEKTELSSISEPGVCDVILSDGTTRECLYLYDNRDSCYPHDSVCSTDYDTLKHDRRDVLLVPTDKRTCQRVTIRTNTPNTKYILGAVKSDLESGADQVRELLTDKPKVGETYVVVDCNSGAVCTGPLQVRKVNTTKGKTRISCGYDDEPCCDSDDRAYTRNPDHNAGYDPEGRLLGAHAMFLRVAASEYGSWLYEDLPLGTWDIADEALRTAGLTKGTIEKQAGYGMRIHLYAGPKADFPYFTSAWGGMKQASVALADGLNLPAGDAMVIADQASRLPHEGRLDFYMDTARMQKSGAMRLVNEPTFHPGSTNAFGIQELPMQEKQVLRVRVDQPDQFPRHRGGDAYDPGGSAGLPRQQIMESSPEELAQLAQFSELPQLFEHGVVGELAGTFDAVSMVDKYIPDMEKGVDALGRTLFLFWWKPGEFQKMYGSDDMQTKEMQLLNTFKQLADTVLSMSKKSSMYQVQRGAAAPTMAE